jgi:preprotein translocase subunit SecE
MKEVEVAKNRGERDDDAELNEGEEFADELDDDVEEFADDEDEDVDAELDPEKETVPPRSGRSRPQGSAARSKAAGKPRTKDDSRPGFLGRRVVFVREVFAELQKVIRPTRRELLTYTAVVVLFVTIMMTFVSLLDVGFAKVLFLVFGGKANTE